MTLSKTKEFSLIELLIVISIVTVLISLVFPSLKKMTEHGLSISCKKQLHALNIGFNYYTEDNDQYITPISQGGGLANKSWVSSIQNYLDESRSDLFHCPSTVGEEKENWAKLSNYSMPLYNGAISARDGKSKYGIVSYHNISKPNEAILLFDNITIVHRYDYFEDFNDYTSRHLLGQYRLFIDGHVQHGIADLDLPLEKYWWKWSLNAGF